MRKPRGGIDLGTDNYTFPVKVHENTAQNLIVTTEDKVELCLMKHRDALAARGGWLVPLGMFLSLFATIAAASEYRAVFGLPPAEVKAVIYVCFIATALWTIVAVTKIRRKPTIADVIRKLKAERNTFGSLEEVVAAMRSQSDSIVATPHGYRTEPRRK